LCSFDIFNNLTIDNDQGISPNNKDIKNYKKTDISEISISFKSETENASQYSQTQSQHPDFPDNLIENKSLDKSADKDSLLDFPSLLSEKQLIETQENDHIHTGKFTSSNKIKPVENELNDNISTEAIHENDLSSQNSLKSFQDLERDLLISSIPESLPHEKSDINKSLSPSTEPILSENLL
jgi:hypothetical protein